MYAYEITFPPTHTHTPRNRLLSQLVDFIKGHATESQLDAIILIT
jgi:hypothetical protein